MAISASNQFTTTGFSYDASGNVLADGTNTYAWNAESEIKTAAGVNYTYDGDGDRVQKSNGKIYWFGAGSEILDESDLSGNFTDEYVYFGGKRIAHRVVSGNAIYYYAEDFLGSSRVMTTSTGTVCYDADFYPFGGERVVTNTCPQNYKFTGKERDAETNNDDFGARYYSSQFGRWISPDWSAIPAPVPYANLTNPQTLNLYSMVNDNPETFSDLDGHGAIALSSQGSTATSADGLSMFDNAVDPQQQQAQQVAAQQSVAQAARDIANSNATAYLQANSKDNYKAGTNKCNQFAADSVQDSGRPRPQVSRSGIFGLFGLKRDPTAHEWADPNVHIPGWSDTKPIASAQPSDVIAQAHGSWGHVGIVVAPGLTASVNSTTNPAGIVTINNWGFRSTGGNGEGPKDPAPVVRSYIGGNP